MILTKPLWLDLCLNECDCVSIASIPFISAVVQTLMQPSPCLLANMSILLARVFPPYSGFAWRSRLRSGSPWRSSSIARRPEMRWGEPVIKFRLRSAFVCRQYNAFKRDMISCLHPLVSRVFSEGPAVSNLKKKKTKKKKKMPPTACVARVISGRLFRQSCQNNQVRLDTVTELWKLPLTNIVIAGLFFSCLNEASRVDVLKELGSTANATANVVANFFYHSCQWPLKVLQQNNWWALRANTKINVFQSAHRWIVWQMTNSVAL